MKYKLHAYDKLNDKKINLWTVLVTKDGSILGITDIDGEMYGMHQAMLTLAKE